MLSKKGFIFQIERSFLRRSLVKQTAGGGVHSMTMSNIAEHG
jgi:hypothetical protein